MLFTRTIRRKFLLGVGLVMVMLVILSASGIWGLNSYRTVIRQLNSDINEALRQPDIVKRLADLSAEPVGGTTAAAAAFMRQEVERWRAVIKTTGIKLE